MTYAHWTRLSEWPLAAAALIFFGIYAWLVIGEPPSALELAIEVLLVVIWVLFAVDYLVRLSLVKARVRWFVRHLHLLAIVILPFFRPLYLIRLVSLVGLLSKSSAFRGQVTMYLVSASSLLIVIASVAILDVEQDAPGALITTFGDAIWWAFVTITTVGYGDLYPVTTAGRLVAGGLMIAGIALLGSVTATFASWFVERVASPAASPAATNTASSEAPDAPGTGDQSVAEASAASNRGNGGTPSA
jgi:voltage-gated potassium channel